MSTAASAPVSTRRSGATSKRFKLHQEYVVLASAALLFAVLSVTLPGFLSAANIDILLKNVSVLALLAVGMSVVVIGRGIDLSQICLMAITSAWVVTMLNAGTPVWQALVLGALFALVSGVVVGIIVAYIEVPAVFATLAFGIFIVGFGRLLFLDRSLLLLQQDQTLLIALGQGRFLGVPIATWICALFWIAFALLMKKTTLGRFIYAIGDNYEAARLSGINVRPIIVAEYTICALVAFAAGCIMAGSVASVNLGMASGTMIFDVLTIIVVGGISLAGGRGGPLSIIAGVALIGTLLTGLIVLNVSSDVQDIIKGAVLLAAIVIDMRLNPRDEETARQGDL